MTKSKKKIPKSSGPEPWVTTNIRVHGNSLVPSELIEEYGVETMEKLISYAAGVRVKITERHPEEIVDDIMEGKHISKGKVCWIAEVTKDGN